PIQSEENDLQEKKFYQRLIHKTIFAGFVSLPLLVISMLNLLPPLHTFVGYLLNFVMGIFTLAVLIYSGSYLFVGGWKAFKNHTANMDTLIAIGTGIAW